MGIHIPSQIINSSGLGAYGAYLFHVVNFLKKEEDILLPTCIGTILHSALFQLHRSPHTRRRSSSELLRLSLIFRIGSQNYCAYIHPHQPHRRATALRVSTSFGLGLGRRLVGLGLNEVRRKALIPIPYTRVVKRLPPTSSRG